MAITDYGSLTSAVRSYIARDDKDGLFPSFINLAEKRMNRELRLTGMIESQVYEGAGTELDLPADFLQQARIQCNAASDWTLKFVPLGQSGSNKTNIPKHFTIKGRKILLVPQPSGALDYTLDYYANIPPIDDTDTTTNWMLQENPDLYLFATLVEAYGHLQSDLVTLYDTKYRALRDNLKDTDNVNKFGGITARSVYAR